MMKSMKKNARKRADGKALRRSEEEEKEERR